MERFRGCGTEFKQKLREDEEEQTEEEITKEEKWKQLKKLKNKKSPGEEKIETEVWINMPVEIREEMLRLLKSI